MKELLDKLYVLCSKADGLYNILKNLIHSLEHEIGERKFYHVCLFCKTTVKEEWIPLDKEAGFDGTYGDLPHTTIDTLCDECSKSPEKVKQYKNIVFY